MSFKKVDNNMVNCYDSICLFFLSLKKDRINYYAHYETYLWAFEI